MENNMEEFKSFQEQYDKYCNRAIKQAEEYSKQKGEDAAFWRQLNYKINFLNIKME